DDATKQLDILQREIQDAHEESKDLEKVLKDLTKEVQEFSREKEEAERRQTEAIKKQTELELDVKDLQERISRHIQAKDDAMKHLDILLREIQDSLKDLDNIISLYE
ncbi:hypothetical protein H0E87_028289, partial [Populus deltoides]